MHLSIKKKFTAFALSAVTLVSVLTMPFTAFAAEQEHTNVKTSTTQSVTVSGTGVSTITCRISDTVTLAPTADSYTGTYTVGVKGDIGALQKVVITVPSTVTLTQANKDAIIATNTFGTAGVDKINATTLETDTFTDRTGTITAALTAGKWEGTFNIQVEIQNFTPQ